MDLTRRGFFGSLAAGLAALKLKRQQQHKGSFTGIKADGKPVVASQYAPLVGGSYAPGQAFNIGSRQTVTSNGTAYYNVAVPDDVHHWTF